MSYVATHNNFGALGKGAITPPPEAPPEDVAPTITPEEELAILESTLPGPEIEPSFLRRNAAPLLLGGGVLLLGTLGLILMVKV